MKLDLILPEIGEEVYVEHFDSYHLAEILHISVYIYKKETLVFCSVGIAYGENSVVKEVRLSECLRKKPE